MASVSAFEGSQKKSLGNEPVRRVTGPDIKSAALLQSFETAGVRRVAGGLLLDKVPPGSYIRSMRMATRFGTSAAGRAKQEQFDAMQGSKIARRMTPIPGTASTARS